MVVESFFLGLTAAAIFGIADLVAGIVARRISISRLLLWIQLGGFIFGLLLTVGTQIAYPVVTGGKPILSIPPMAIVMYEGTMLGAIIMTVFGIVFESRLPRLFMGAYDDRITEGYIGIVVTTQKDMISNAEAVLKEAGAEDIKRGWEGD